MKISFIDNQCIVKKQDTDPKFYDGGWSDGESKFLYHLKKALNESGYDLIKKRMWKDGHLMDDTQQYLRVRKFNKKYPKMNISIHNPRYAIRGANQDFNDGEVVLMVTKDYFLD